MRRNYFKFYQDKGKNREPCWTLADLSRSTGVHHSTLSYRMRKSNNAPEVQFTLRGRIFYKKSELEAWHEGFKKNNDAA